LTSNLNNDPLTPNSLAMVRPKTAGAPAQR
jgi:hypothetical protein